MRFVDDDLIPWYYVTLLQLFLHLPKIAHPIEKSYANSAVLKCLKTTLKLLTMVRQRTCVETVPQEVAAVWYLCHWDIFEAFVNEIFLKPLALRYFCSSWNWDIFEGVLTPNCQISLASSFELSLPEVM